MKKPLYNEFDRLLTRMNTINGSRILLDIAKKRFLREIERWLRGNKITKYKVLLLLLGYSIVGGIKSVCYSFIDKTNCNGYKLHGRYACNWCALQTLIK